MAAPARAAALTAMCLALALGLSGCYPSQNQPDYRQARLANQDFDAGADRPASPRTLYAMSRVMAGQGRQDEQAALLRRAIQQQKEFLPAYNDLAQLYLSRHDPKAALATLQKALEVAPNDPVVVNNAGMCHLFMRDYPAALERFNQAARLAPRQGKYRANAALALSMLGRYDEAMELYKQVLPPSKAHYNLGVMHQARKELLEALREYDQARQLESASAAAALDTPAPLLAPATGPME